MKPRERERLLPSSEGYIRLRQQDSPRKSGINHGRPPKIEPAGAYEYLDQSWRRGGGNRKPGYRWNNGTHFYPFERMEIGQSFWVADPDEKACTRVAVIHFAKKSGWKFTTRKQAQNGQPNRAVEPNLRGLRVWRLE